GSLAGTVTGILFARFKINALLSGILVMTSLYSLNLLVMGKSNQPVAPQQTVFQSTDAFARLVFGSGGPFFLWGWEVDLRDASALLFSFVLILITGVLLYAFFRTDLGTSMRATGDNKQMIRALGCDDGLMTILGLAMANGLVALSGALLAQYQGFADVQMGIGMVVWGLASVIIGEALVGTRQLGYLIVGAVMGSVLFRLLVAVALRAGLNPNHLKAITALFVFGALVLPKLLEHLKKPKAEVQSA
ncbi:MAG: ABC transporter permease, partial [Acidobacteria bacterium]|nr:ABC transporter permease [Acidobacteriota bacterium]